MCIDDKTDIDVASSLKDIAVDVRMLSEAGALCIYYMIQVLHGVQVTCFRMLLFQWAVLFALFYLINAFLCLLLLAF